MGENVMLQSGRVVFGQMEEVLFGRPAADAIVEVARRLDASRVFLMVSGTLNRETDEVEKVRRALGERYAGNFDQMPPHTPRRAVIAAAEQAREARADLIATIGGGSITGETLLVYRPAQKTAEGCSADKQKSKTVGRPTATTPLSAVFH
jgi:alcohol dehydrogenase class IV